MEVLMSRETEFQHKLINEIEARFPGSLVMKLDPTYIQGIPDLLILHEDHWATLECKKSASSPARPNQPYYVDLMNKMSFSAFIFPENKEAVLNAMEQSFSRRS
jgi:hypothetical protein